jgi:hypothetical protein
MIAAIKKQKKESKNKVRADMTLKIKEVKSEMLSKNENNLVGTTKLTVFQNVQLTGELEYHSMQTENLMYQNHVMQ